MFLLILAILLILSLELGETSIVIPIILFLIYLIWDIPPRPTPTETLEEAAAKIEKDINQLRPQYSWREAEQKVAEELANKAKKDPNFKKKLKILNKSLLDPNTKTTLTKTVKYRVQRVILMALSLLV